MYYRCFFYRRITLSFCVTVCSLLTQSHMVKGFPVFPVCLGDTLRIVQQDSQYGAYIQNNCSVLRGSAGDSAGTEEPFCTWS